MTIATLADAWWTSLRGRELRCVVDIADELLQALRAEFAGLPEIRDQLTSHVADTAQKVEARLLNEGDPADEAS